jgi:hypothetical protein
MYFTMIHIRYNFHVIRVIEYEQKLVSYSTF